MNLVITDSANKKFQSYISANYDIELFICDNINTINKKNNTFLTVRTDVNVSNLVDQGFTMDQGMFDRLVLNYNNSLQPGEEILSLWKRGL